MDVIISEIGIGKRHRRELGDIKELAASIEAVGLLHPVVLRPDKTLIAGQRRIEAYRLLKRSAIPANTAHNLSELSDLLKAECDENTCRLPFSPTEAVAIGAEIEAAFKPVAEAAKKEHGKTAPGKQSLRGNSPKCSESARTTAVAAKAVGMDRRTYEKAKAVVASAESEPEKGKALAEEMDRTGKVNGAFKKMTTARAAEEIRNETPPLPTGPFRVIVADPPWRYDNRPDDPTHRAANPYPTMTIQELAAMNVKAIAHDDAVLWLWVTNAFLPDVWPIITAWGFTYKTTLTWVKDRMGTGDWLRGKTEHCLMCIRGKPTITLTNQTTVIYGAMREHSRKPDEFFSLIDGLCPGSKCELFQRNAREGYVGHGNEAGH
jgi:N6-adenosine-specific RNA methylase IME4/ParB-like chromosome segregation protein Spo0J